MLGEAGHSHSDVPRRNVPRNDIATISLLHCGEGALEESRKSHVNGAGESPAR